MDTLTYWNGTWHEGNPAILGPRDHAFWLGSTVFDGGRAFGGCEPGAFVLLGHDGSDRLRVVREKRALYTLKIFTLRQAHLTHFPQAVLTGFCTAA